MPVRFKWDHNYTAYNFQEMEQLIDETVSEWIEKSQAILIKAVKRKRIKNSGELLKSFESAVAIVAKGRVSADFGFSTHGRIIDQKNVEFTTKHPPISIIYEWVKKVGLENFEYVPGYKGSNKSKFEIPKAHSRIASAISFSRTEKFFKQKQRSWFNKNFYSLVRELESKLLTSISINALKELIEKIEI